MRAADTNLLVRLLVRDHAAQAAAAEAFIAPGAWVSVLALAECVWVLEAVYGRQPSQLAAGVEGLLQHPALVVESAVAVSLALQQFRLRPQLSFSDCLLLELARAAGHLPLGTFDRNLARAPGAVRLP